MDLPKAGVLRSDEAETSWATGAEPAVDEVSVSQTTTGEPMVACVLMTPAAECAVLTKDSAKIQPRFSCDVISCVAETTLG